MKTHFPIILAVVFCSLLLSCGDNNGPSVPPYATGCENVLVRSASLVHRGGDTIDVYWHEKIVENRTCGDSAFPRITYDTTMADTSTFIYDVNGDSLFLTTPDGITANFTIYMVFLRTENGSGLNGAWMYDTVVYRPENLDSATRGVAAALCGFVISVYGPLFKDVTWHVSAAQIVTYASTSFADNFAGIWNTLYASTHAIRIDTLNECQVRLSGDVSQEVVTVTGDYQQNVLYQSSDTAHHPYVKYQLPAQCPNDAIPPWWADFLAANPQ